MEWAAEQNVFELPLGATPYIPIPDIGTVSGCRTPVEGVGYLRFFFTDGY